MTLDRAIDIYLTGRELSLSAQTLKTYKISLDQFAKYAGRDAELEKITVHDLRAYASSLKRAGLGNYTIHKYTRELKTFFNWLELEGVLTINPTRRMENIRIGDHVPKVATVENIRKALEWLNGRLADGTEPPAILCRTRFVLMFLAETGCRMGGLMGLRLEHFDMKTKEAVVFEKGRGGKKKRTVFFSEATAAALQDWLMYRPESEHDYILTNAGRVLGGKGEPGDRVQKSAIGHSLKRLKAEAGIKGAFNPHAFRHGAARAWLLNGADLATVSQLLGHSGIEVTAKHYATWASRQLKEQHQKYANHYDVERVAS